MASYKSLTNAKLLKCSFDGTPIVGTVQDANSPEWLEDELWTGSRFKDETNECIVKDDVALTVKTRPSYAAGRSIVSSLFETAGSTESSGFFNGYVKRSLPTEPTALDVVVDYVVDVCTYADCLVNSLMITGTQSGPIEVEVGLLGVDRAVTTGSVSAPTAARPAIMADASISVGGTTYAVNGFTINLNQAMESDFNNSLYRDSAGLGVFEGTIDLVLNMNADTYSAFFSTLTANTPVTFAMKAELSGNGFGIGCTKLVFRGQPFSAAPETGFWKPTLSGVIRGSDIYGYTLTA